MKPSTANRMTNMRMSSTPSKSENHRSVANVKPRIYIGTVTFTTKSGTAISARVWMGRSPAGRDWTLGSVSLFSLEEAMAFYCRKLTARLCKRARRAEQLEVHHEALS